MMLRWITETGEKKTPTHDYCVFHDVLDFWWHQGCEKQKRKRSRKTKNGVLTKSYMSATTRWSHVRYCKRLDKNFVYHNGQVLFSSKMPTIRARYSRDSGFPDYFQSSVRQSTWSIVFISSTEYSGLSWIPTDEATGCFRVPKSTGLSEIMIITEHQEY